MGCWGHFGVTGTDIARSHSPVPLVNTHRNRWLHIFQEERCAWADKGLGGRNVCNPRQWEMWADSLALWTMFPFQLGLKGGWGSPQVISMRNLALSQLFPLPFYCLLSQLRMWIVLLSCIWAVFFWSDVQLLIYMVIMQLTVKSEAALWAVCTAPRSCVLHR